MSDEESDCICKLSWECWDWLVDRLARGTAEELKGYMCEAELFTQPGHRNKLVVVAQDATPVYLAGKNLVRADTLEALRRRRLAKRIAQRDMAAAVVEPTGVAKPNDGEGSSRREKNRLTYFMRQSLHGLLDPDLPIPVGRIRDGVLLTHAAKHARLEDMSFAKPSYWLRSHSFEIDGKVEHRTAGDSFI